MAVVAVLLFRVALSVLLPTMVHRTARSFGFDLTYGRLDLNLLGTQAGTWDLTLRARDAPNKILHADYGFPNISSPALFKLKLRAYRLEVWRTCKRSRSRTWRAAALRRTRRR